MIVSFRSKALEPFWWKGEVRRVDARHVERLRRLLADLEDAKAPKDMNLPGSYFHPLVGDQSGRYAVRVNKNWRLTFGWSDHGPDALDVDYEDYH